MSKEIFSQKISDTMVKKINAIENLNLDILFEEDEYFELALCLSYMTLSKEKIIDKDIKNQDRINRLSKKVDMLEIDKVFQNAFSKEMPKIMYAKENNNLWILDNIRDSIMHGAFDIDLEKKCFLINNTQHDRQLTAEIPFSWFIDYAKNNILSKRIFDKFTVKGFYYNSHKVTKKYFETSKELMNNILYKVNITGNNINVKNIEKRIKELFLMYSNEEIDDKLILEYKNRIDNEKIKYNEKYLVSFYIASDKVKEEIEKEYKGVCVNIFIDNRKHKFVNKTSKKLPIRYHDYNLMFEHFNKELLPKGINLLNYLSNIIENFDKCKSLKKESYFEKVRNINILLNDNDIKKMNNAGINVIAEQNLKTLRSILLNVYGLSTLVINHENLYNPYFLNDHPNMYGIKACLKNPYLEYARKRKTIIMKILDNDIALFLKLDQFNKCKSESGKVKIEELINNLKLKKTIYETELQNLSFESVIKYENINYIKKNKLESIIKQCFNHFDASTTVLSKTKLKKIINHLLEVQIEEEAKYTYGFCNNMKEVLTIIRNCFSHIGRINISKDKGFNTILMFNDYDTNHEKSGEVICKYNDLIQLLKGPCIESEKKIIKK